MIEFGFSQKDAYDFVIKNERRETIKNDKKVVEKLRAVKYRNPEIDCWGYVNRMTAENAPEVLKNVEYFRAANPFGKFGTGEKYEPYGWTLPMALLAFKKGYIDGWLSSSGGLFQPIGTLNTEGIIIVDPIRRIEVRKYFEKEFKTFFENCKEEDFDYALFTNWGYGARIGKSLHYESFEDVKKKFAEDEDLFKTDAEKESVAKYGFDKVCDALAKLIFYTDTDMYNIWGQRTGKPMTFESIEKAKEFKNEYNKWQEIYHEEDSVKSIDIAPVNDTFETWIRKRA